MKKGAFTLLELLVVIAMVAVIASLSVSDFSFAYSGAKRPPQAVLANSLKLARISAMELGEEVSLFFDAENSDMVLRKTFSGETVFRKNLFSLSEEDKKKLAEDAGYGAQSYPEISVLFRPNYPRLYNFSRSDSDGAEFLDSLRFSPNSSSTPAFVELLINGARRALFKLDPLSAMPLATEGIDEK